MTKMKLIISIVMMVTLSMGSVAGDKKIDKKYFTITDVEVRVVDESDFKKDGVLNPASDEIPNSTTSSSSTPTTSPPLQLSQVLENVNQVIDTLDRIVNLAQRFWEIIEKNQPVVDISVNYANALPLGVQHWTQLQGWSKPKTVKYSFVAKNAYGVKVVKVVYQIHLTYGGNYQGRGKFLTGVTIEPISVETLWGYKVSLKAEVPDSTIANVGTHEDPIASMQVKLKWTIQHTFLKDSQQQAIYYVDGTGKVEEIATPFKNSAEIKSIKVDPIDLKDNSPVVDKIRSADF